MLKTAYRLLGLVDFFIELFKRPPGASTTHYLLRVAARIAFILGILTIAIVLLIVLTAGDYRSNHFWVTLILLATVSAIWIYGGFLVLDIARELVRSLRGRKP